MHSNESKHAWYLFRNFENLYTAGVSRRQVKNLTKSVKNIKILEFGVCIWNHHKKCIQMSPNMPGICLDICEIFENFEEEKCMDGESNGRVQSINTLYNIYIYLLCMYIAGLPDVVGPAEPRDAGRRSLHDARERRRSLGGVSSASAAAAGRGHVLPRRDALDDGGPTAPTAQPHPTHGARQHVVNKLNLFPSFFILFLICFFPYFFSLPLRTHFLLYTKQKQYLWHFFMN